MNTIIAKLEEMRTPYLSAIKSNAMDSHLAVEKLSVLDDVSKMVHDVLTPVEHDGERTLISKIDMFIEAAAANTNGNTKVNKIRESCFIGMRGLVLDHIGECAINFHGENVVVLGDLDNESGRCETSPVTPEQVEDMHSEAQEAAKQFAALLGAMTLLEPEYEEIATPALDRLGYFSQVEIMVEEIQKGDMSAVDLISEMRDAFVDRHHGMTIFEITSAETLDLMLAIEEIEAICEYLEIRLDPRKTHDEWSAEFDQEAGGPDFGQEVIASESILGILGISLEPVDLQTLLDPVPEYQDGGDVLVIFMELDGPIDPLRERYNELLDQKAALQADHDSTDSDNIHFIAARANIRHTIGEIDRELEIIKQDL
jgi:hypothetical protein